MAQHKSAEKRIRISARRQVINQAAESKIKTSVKKVLASKNKEEAEKLYKEAVSILDKGSTKGLIKKNTASRKKSLITRHLNKLQPAKPASE
jgi:small subunit ribosomal protein S20